ncbi:MAG TPA: FAD-dependent oxidoreductase [Thermoanaerobaculia bacterium]|jgi:FAD/FMN-containing dehydrogenase
MNRREFLKHAASLPALPALSPLLNAMAPSAKTFRRVRPADPDWPSAAAWDALKEKVGGRLIPVADPLSPCRPVPSSPACAARLDDLKNPFWLGEQPGATQISGWLDAWTSAPSVYAVAAKNAQDVAAAVDFAREHRLRLVVKGGGHSYLGTSNAPDSLLIWTHEMRAITLHDAFKPAGCASARRAVTVEAGARWIEVYDAVTTKAGRYVQGGGCTTVGVIGLVTGGGFGSFSKRFGMAAASLLEAEVVTADGKIRIANACTNSDLFWALKGGGGGTFGVVTKITLATHDLPEFAGGASGAVRVKSDAAMRRLIDWFLPFAAKTLVNANWGESVKFDKDTFEIGMVSIGLSHEATLAAWKPLQGFVAASPSDYEWAEAISGGATQARNWWDVEWRDKYTPGEMIADPRPGAPKANVVWKGDAPQATLFLYAYESMWLPAGLLKDDAVARLGDALFAASRQFEVQLHFNKGLAGAPAERIAEARDAATNPAVLDAFALAIIASGRPMSSPNLPGREPPMATARDDAGRIAAAADRLREIAPDSGSYFNETNYFERGFQKSFWGPNYARLAEVKKKYDPDGLFFVHHGVGSEEWDKDGFVRTSR